MGRGIGYCHSNSIVPFNYSHGMIRKPKFYYPKCDSENIKVSAENCQCRDCGKIF